MFESTIHFTMTGLLFAGAVPVILAALLWLVGRSVPPAVRDARAGIGGLLLLVLLILSVKAVLSMFDLGHQAGEAVRVISVDSNFAWPAIKSTLPAIVNTVSILSVLVLLAIGRTRGALFTALALVWVAGPGDDLLKMLILGIPFDLSQGFLGISFFTILVTLYLLLSVRSSMTYGLPGASRRVYDRAE